MELPLHQQLARPGGCEHLTNNLLASIDKNLLTGCEQEVQSFFAGCSLADLKGLKIWADSGGKSAGFKGSENTAQVVERQMERMRKSPEATIKGHVMAMLWLSSYRHQRTLLGLK